MKEEDNVFLANDEKLKKEAEGVANNVVETM